MERICFKSLEVFIQPADEYSADTHNQYLKELGLAPLNYGLGKDFCLDVIHSSFCKFTEFMKQNEF